MADPKVKFEIVATPTFPTYAIAAVTGRHVVVGGGGGAARTGIKNKFDVYELYHDGKQTRSERVVSHDVGDSCISNLAGWPDPNIVDPSDSSPPINLALGQDEKCCLLKLHPKLGSPLLADDIVFEDTVVEEPFSEETSNLRNRIQDMKPNIDKLKEVAARKRKQEKLRRESINCTLRGEQYFTFDIEELVVKNSVFNKSNDPTLDIYQKVVRVSPDHTTLCTGGTDGKLRIWSLPGLKITLTIDAHKKEVDDLDFKPNGKQIVSLCKPSKECCVWNLKDGKKVIQLVLTTNGIKYKFYKARYGTVENSAKDCRLFTISNPVVGTKHPGIITKWTSSDHREEKSQPLKGTLSNLAVSGNGRYIAAGTMDGSIYLVIGFSLQVLRKIESAHSMFVTGLEWMPTDCSVSNMVCGFSDASVLSISCDNTLKIHHIPRQTMLPIWVVAVLVFFVLLGTFIFASFIGL